MDSPTGGTRIPDLSSFRGKINRCSHIAVYRPIFGIYHHYMVIEIDDASMNIIHAIGSVSVSLASLGFAEIKEETVDFTNKSEHLDFEAGVYLITKPGYPCTENEKTKVLERAKTRLGEKDFKLSSNNCEWFASWAMRGVGESEQIQNARPMKRLVADFVDSTFCNYRSASGKAAIERILCLAAGIDFTLEAAPKLGPFFKLLKGSANTSYISTAVYGAAICVPIEILACCHSIYSLYKKLKANHFDKRTFNREVTKKCVGSFASAGGTIGGAVLGQMLIPIPFLGGIIGGILGSMIGRIIGSVISGMVYDHVDSI